MNNTFNNWIRLTNQSTQVDNEKYSHLLLNGTFGGKLYIKKENMNVFFRKYSDAIINNEKLYIVETRGELFPLFFDLDFKIGEELWKSNEETLSIFKEIIVHIFDTVKIFYNCEFTCYVTDAEIKTISNSEDKKIIKKGFHIHFPEIIIRSETALKIRKMCVSKLKMIYGNIFENTFGDIVDETVFIKNGLRMTGSCKGTFKTCSVSKQKVFEDEGRPYSLLFYIDTLGKIISEIKNETENDNENKSDYKKLSLLDIIKKTSIFCFEEDAETEINKLDLEEGEDACYKCDTDSEEESTGNSSKNKTKLGEANWFVIGKSETVYKEIIKYFANNVKDYSSNDIKRIFRNEEGTLYNIWTKSKYCQNIGRDHNSCGIYFSLNKNGICQRCFCKCDTQEGRKYGYCHSFYSTHIPCTPHIKKILGFKDNKDESNEQKIKSFVLKSKNADMTGSMNELRNLLYNSFTNKSPIKQKREPKEPKGPKKD